jgi:aminopeptidase-like protein
MKQIIEDLYPLNRTLLGEGYDSALKYLAHLIDLDVQVFPTGTKVGDWTVPEEWVIRDAWVKYKGKKFIDMKKDPLAVITYSEPVNKEVDLEEKRQIKRPSLIRKNYCFDANFF